MKQLSHFRATRVFTHLEMDIVFHPDLTFLYGLNGSGKTTALRLIMGLLQPSIETLAAIDFQTAKISGESHDHGNIDVSAEKSGSTLLIKCSIVDEAFEVPLDVMETEEPARLIAREAARSKTIAAIRSVSSPMFLGIDRRFITPFSQRRGLPIGSSRDMASRFRNERMAREDRSYDPGLAEVADVIDTYVARLHGAQELINEQFRKELLLESFTYADPAKRGLSFETPSEEAFRDFRNKRAAISRALQALDLASDEFEEKSEGFFRAIEDIITTIRRGAGVIHKGKELDKELSEALTAWFVNQSQMERINRLFELTTKYQGQTEKTQKQLIDFMALVNQFFSQTGKTISIGREGGVRIKMQNGSTTSLQALSSGERQIFIMLAHLSLNKKLLRDGVFIVDEPELSLHLGWQDMFVEAIQKANPRLQLILATHAPAIIGGRDNLCVPVSTMSVP